MPPPRRAGAPEHGAKGAAMETGHTPSGRSWMWLAAIALMGTVMSMSWTDVGWAATSWATELGERPRGARVATSISGRHSCALIADATVRCWGDNEFGQLGDDTTQQRTRPVQVQGLA